MKFKKILILSVKMLTLCILITSCDSKIVLQDTKPNFAVYYNNSKVSNGGEVNLGQIKETELTKALEFKIVNYGGQKLEVKDIEVTGSPHFELLANVINEVDGKDGSVIKISTKPPKLQQEALKIQALFSFKSNSQIDSVFKANLNALIIPNCDIGTSLIGMKCLCSNGASNPPACNECANGAVNFPTCNECTNGAGNFPACNECSNGAGNFPACNECANGAVNFPACNECSNGAVNFPACDECFKDEKNIESISYEVSTTMSVNLNIVFVVDTSGSMGNEIDHVRSNMDLFVNNIKNDFSDKTKFVVIGTKLSDKYLLPNSYLQNATYNDVYWHYKAIYSRDKLKKILNSYNISGYENATYKFPGDFNITGACAIDKLLYNCDSQTHMVIVTDDEESLDGSNDQKIIKNNFLSKFSQAHSINNNHFVMHGINAKASSTCSISRLGTIYEEMGNETGGISLDICANDWTPLFNSLKERIGYSAQRKYLDYCKTKDRVLIKVSVIHNSNLIVLPSKAYTYFPPIAPSTAPSITLIPNEIAALGIPFDTQFTLKVEYTLK